jgi:hypothetical protein
LTCWHHSDEGCDRKWDFPTPKICCRVTFGTCRKLTVYCMNLFWCDPKTDPTSRSQSSSEWQTTKCQKTTPKIKRKVEFIVKFIQFVTLWCPMREIVGYLVIENNYLKEICLFPFCILCWKMTSHWSHTPTNHTKPTPLVTQSTFTSWGCQVFRAECFHR